MILEPVSWRAVCDGCGKTFEDDGADVINFEEDFIAFLRECEGWVPGDNGKIYCCQACKEKAQEGGAKVCR